jgi:D-glycero-D-manno-heptose 1,7-bisphosphate phosphatase
MTRAVFIDRDGVICRNRSDYVKSWEEFVFLPGARTALAHLATLDLPIVIVTNQSPINRQIIAADVVEEIHQRMTYAIKNAGGRVDRVLYCPHRPDEGCDCRKPQPGMLLTAARELDLDLSRSYLIGDAASDMQAGRVVGCRCYLVLTGRGQEQLFRCCLYDEQDFTLVQDLAEAVKAIFHQELNPSGNYAGLIGRNGHS